MTDEEKKERQRIRSAKWYIDNREKVKANVIAWKKKNPDKKRAANAAWRKKNPEKARASTSAWQKANIEKGRAKAMKWYKANPEKARAATIAWRKANPGASKQHGYNKRASKKANGGKLSPDLEAKLLTFQKNRCAICRVSLKKTRHELDHVVPLARGGKNSDNNMQITCPTCNRKKHAKDPIVFMREKGFLL